MARVSLVGFIISLLLVTVACTSTVQEQNELSSGPHPANSFDVLSYNVSLSPNLDTGHLVGAEAIVFTASTKLSELVFPTNELTISAAELNGMPTGFQTVDGELRVRLPAATHMPATLALRYSGTPKRGYHVGSSSIHTTYFACDWMICHQEDFHDKAQFSLALTLPRKMVTVGPGRLVAEGVEGSGEYRVTWEEKRPYSPFLYAFAVGDYQVFTSMSGKTQLEIVSSIESHDALRSLFASTSTMLQFFEDKAGVAFPHAVYTQVYVKGNAAQEAISHSIIGQNALELILQNPQEDWVVAHELAHQWWGNSVTCLDITEFWLNEGLTTFMVAAWKEHQWGRAAYDRELGFAKRRYQRAIDADMDVPLSYKEEHPSLGIRRAIQYSKGALFIDALRTELGDDEFWSGLHLYTQSNWGKTVTSKHLQAAFETSSGRDLSMLFNEWVY